MCMCVNIYTPFCPFCGLLCCQDNTQQIENTCELLFCFAIAAVLVQLVFLSLLRCFLKSHFLRDNWVCHPWLSIFHPICYSSYYSCSKIPQTGWIEMYRSENILLCDQAFKPYLIPKYREAHWFPVVDFQCQTTLLLFSLSCDLGDSKLFDVQWNKTCSGNEKAPILYSPALFKKHFGQVIYLSWAFITKLDKWRCHITSTNLGIIDCGFRWNSPLHVFAL